MVRLLLIINNNCNDDNGIGNYNHGGGNCIGDNHGHDNNNGGDGHIYTNK